jgi:hypothetical protein
VKCVAYNFDGSNFIDRDDEDEGLENLKFENGDVIPNVNDYFIS